MSNIYLTAVIIWELFCFDLVDIVFLFHVLSNNLRSNLSHADHIHSLRKMRTGKRTYLSISTVDTPERENTRVGNNLILNSTDL